jgi:hypothetical protein
MTQVCYGNDVFTHPEVMGMGQEDGPHKFVALERFQFRITGMSYDMIYIYTYVVYIYII